MAVTQRRPLYFLTPSWAAWTGVALVDRSTDPGSHRQVRKEIPAGTAEACVHRVLDWGIRNRAANTGLISDGYTETM